MLYRHDKVNNQYIWEPVIEQPSRWDGSKWVGVTHVLRWDGEKWDDMEKEKMPVYVELEFKSGVPLVVNLTIINRLAPELMHPPYPDDYYTNLTLSGRYAGLMRFPLTFDRGYARVEVRNPSVWDLEYNPITVGLETRDGLRFTEVIRDVQSFGPDFYKEVTFFYYRTW